MYRCTLILAGFLLVFAAVAASPACRISKPRFPEYATEAIQAAVTRCSSLNGTVIFDPGTYLSAALVIGGSVTILLSPGARLVAGTQRDDYPGPQPEWYLLRFKNCTGCRLTGGGTIDGQGRAWVVGRLPDRKLVQNFRDASCPVANECRPRLVGVVDSQGVQVTGVTLHDSIYWGLHVVRSTGVTVEGVTIQSDWDIPNTDGIDIDGSTHVKVSHCKIHTADDAVCLKTTHPSHPLRGVSIHHCTLRSRSSAVKIGSESRADISDAAFEHLKVQDSHRGLAVQLRDGGSVRNISFAHIALSTRYYNSSWWGGAEPIYVTSAPRTDLTQVGEVSGVRFSHIRGISENGIFIAGSAGQPPPAHIIISHSTFHLAKRTLWPGGRQDYRPSVRGLQRSGSTAPVWVEHAQHVKVQGVEIVYHPPFREDWELSPHGERSSVQDISFHKFSIRMAKAAEQLGRGGQCRKGVRWVGARGGEGEGGACAA